MFRIFRVAFAYLISSPIAVNTAKFASLQETLKCFRSIAFFQKLHTFKKKKHKVNKIYLDVIAC